MPWLLLLTVVKSSFKGIVSVFRSIQPRHWMLVFPEQWRCRQVGEH